MAEHKTGFLRRVFSKLWGAITCLRVALANIIFILIVLIIASALIPDKAPLMPDQTALRIVPAGFLVDQYSYTDPLTQILEQSQAQDMETRVSDLVIALDRAGKDTRITALVLELNDFIGGGISKLEEVGAALNSFKKSGKPIYAVASNYTQEQYYLASYADEIFLNPMGAVMLTGYGNYRNYFKDAIDKLSLNFHVFKVGEFKDAVEPFTQNEMSDASREHNSLWINDLWGVYTRQIENLRHLSEGSIDDYINHMGRYIDQYDGDGAKTAQQFGLVDQLATTAIQSQFLINKFGLDPDSETYQSLDVDDYLSFTDREQSPNPNRIGLIIAKGMILNGKHPEGNVGGDTYAKLIRQARKDSSLSGLVIRIDSGGGSAFASELIRQELDITRKQGLPVFISMGSVAASGGYWMSMAADEVWATPTTLTGSIGVFSAFPTIENSLDKLGVATDGVGSTELAGALRIDRPLSPLISKILQASVDNIYKRFITLVADARRSTPAQIHAVAQGRVWTGAAAKELGLVDELGGLQDTLNSAAKRAGLEDYDIRIIRPELSPMEQLTQQLAENISMPNAVKTLTNSATGTLLKALEETFAPLQMLQMMNDPASVYAQCLSCSPP